MTWTWAACIIGAYLIGSIPFGVIIARARGIDIRQHGSKNIGATNVGRVLGRRLGVLCFVLDTLKGAVPVLVSGLVTGVARQRTSEFTQPEMCLWLAVAIAAVLGHMFPLYARLRGGKGVATGFGALVAMWPMLTWPALAALAVWFIVLRTWRYMALASMCGAITLPIASAVIAVADAEDPATALGHFSPVIIITAALALLVVWRHRDNVSRLLAGTESKVGGRASGAEETHDRPGA